MSYHAKLQIDIACWGTKAICDHDNNCCMNMWLVTNQQWFVLRLGAESMLNTISDQLRFQRDLLFVWDLFSGIMINISTDPDSKVHGANMGPTWVLPAQGGPHVGPRNLAIRDVLSIMYRTIRKILQPPERLRSVMCSGHVLSHLQIISSQSNGLCYLNTDTYLLISQWNNN